ncbi:MAG: hypothetical protein Q4P08_06860 [Eubacteriales bacterium]|nr:hypothetical protein [Eubacteriales bacterium]
MRTEKKKVGLSAKSAGSDISRPFNSHKLYPTVLILLCLSLILIFSGCQAGVKLNPSDSDLPGFTVTPDEAEVKASPEEIEKAAAETQPAEEEAAVEDSSTDPASPEAETEPKEAKKDESTKAKDEAEAKDEKANEKAEDSKKDEAAKASTAKAEPEPDYPSAKDVQAKLKEKDFNFYVNNLVNDPEPEAVVYADKAAGKAELTVFYAIFKDSETADRAIANLLESDMIGKAISFGAKLDKVHDKAGDKLYTVNLKSFLATARAEMRQDGERIGLVLLYKKNDDVVFEPYFELMGFKAP